MKTSLFILVPLLVLLSACGDNLTSEQHLERARAFLDENDYGSTLIELRNGAQKDQDNAELRYELGKVLLRAGDFLSAEKELLRAQNLGIVSSSIQPFLLEALAKQGAHERVIEQLELALASGLNVQMQAYVFGLAAQSHVALNQYNNAHNLVAKALALDAEQKDALIARARLFLIEDDRVKARQWVNKAHSLDNNFAPAWSLMADMDVVDGDFDAAYDGYTRAIELRPYTTHNTGKRLRVAVAADRLDEAESDLKQLQQSSFKNYWYTHHLEGLLLFKQGDYQGAANSFDRSLAAVPDFPETLIYSAVSQSLLGNHEQAQRLADQLSGFDSFDTQAEKLKGSILLRMGDFEAAEKVLLGLESEGEGQSYLLKVLARISLATGSPAEAEAYAARLLATGDDDEAARELIVIAKLMAGKDLQADLASMENSDDPYKRQLWLAISELHQGRALSARKKAVQLRIDFPDATEPQRLIASTYLAVQDWGRARIELMNVLKSQEGEITSLMNLVNLEIVVGNRDEVVAKLGELAKYHENNLDAILFSYDINLRLRDEPAALAVLEAGLGNIGKNDTLLAKLIEHHFLLGRYEPVIELSEGLSNEFFNGNPQAMEILALSHGKEKNFSQALKFMEGFMARETPSYRTYNNYGDFLLAARDVNAALKAYGTAVSLAPNDLELRSKVIRILAQYGRYDESERLLNEALKKNATSAELLALDGWVAMLKQDYSTAEKRMKESLSLNPKAENVILLARVLAYQGKSSSGLEVLNQWLEKTPSDLNVLLHKAGLYLARGDDVRALSTYKEVLNYHSEHVATLNNVAWLSREENIEEALTTAEKAYSLSPSDPFVLDTLGSLKMLSGDLGSGLVLLQQAAESAPGDMQIKLNLAKALLKSDDKLKAKALFRSVADSNPQGELAQEAEQMLQEL